MTLSSLQTSVAPLKISQLQIHKKTPHFTPTLSVACMASWKGREDSLQSLKVIEALAELGYGIKILARGHQAALTELLGQRNGIEVLEDNEKNQRQMLKSVDVLWTPFGFASQDLLLAQKYQLIPVAPDTTAELKNFNPSKEEGNAFLYEAGDFYDTLRAFIRAAENRQFSYDWGNLKKAVGKVGASG